MKEIIGIIVIIIVVGVASFAMQRYLKKTSDEILLILNKLKENIIISLESSDIETVKKISKEVVKKWEEIDEVWSNVVMHQELDNIRLSILEVNGAIEAGSLDDALEEIDKTIFLTGHIKEKEAFRLKNIF